MAKMVKAPVDHPYPSLYRDSHHLEFWFIIFLSVFCLEYKGTVEFFSLFTQRPSVVSLSNFSREVKSLKF